MIVVGAAILGAIFGSFIGALVIRWPLGRSVIHGRSECDGCGYQPNALELIPIISFLALRGKCRKCGCTIDNIHLVSEIVAAGIAALAFALLPLQDATGFAVFGLLALPLVLLDIRHHWLPDRLTLLLALTGLAAAFWLWPDELALRLVGAALAYLLLEILRRGYRRYRNIEGMGAGDPKLFGAIALWTGPYALPLIMLLASGIGIIWHLATRDNPRERFPLGALLLIAALIVQMVYQGQLFRP